MKRFINQNPWSKWVVILGCLGLGQVSCVEEEEGEPMFLASSQRIMGGQQDTSNQYPYVVSIRIKKGNATGQCTGTLIAPNLVLTAQHCVAATTTGQSVSCTQTRFRAPYLAADMSVTTKGSNSGATFIKAKEVHVPAPGALLCSNDIALLILEQNVPSSDATPVEPRLEQPPQVGEMYTAVGFGQIWTETSPGRFTIMNGGRRFVRSNREVLCANGSCSQPVQLRAKELYGTEGTCPGDSGGPPLDSQNRVLGALSRGPQGCKGSVYTTVSGWKDWIKQYGQRAAMLGGYTAPAWATGASQPPVDGDGDGVPDNADNCPSIPNADQADMDNDGLGDACDATNNNMNNGTNTGSMTGGGTTGGSTSNNTNTGGNSTGDDDLDLVDNSMDNCPMTKNKDQLDSDGDGLGDVCDPDIDDDGVPNDIDLCPKDEDPSQVDTDGDGFGDECDLDDDNDNKGDLEDNCPLVVNAPQTDTDGDGIGDACDGLTGPGGGVVPGVVPGGGPVITLPEKESEGSSTANTTNGQGSACSNVGSGSPLSMGWWVLLGFAFLKRRRLRR